MNSKLKSAVLLGLPILLSITLSIGLQQTVLANREAFNTWLSNFGPFVILVYIVLQVITIVIAPIGGLFLILAMIALFGPTTALIIVYLVATPCYLINFYLARRYGRPLVQRILGKHSLEKLDEFIKDAGLPILILTRLLQGGSFDYLSYGWGLTQIPFKTFAIVNFLVGIPATIITYTIFSQVENLTYALIIFYILTGLFAIISIYTHKKLRQRR